MPDRIRFGSASLDAGLRASGVGLCLSNVRSLHESWLWAPGIGRGAQGFSARTFLASVPATSRTVSEEQVPSPLKWFGMTVWELEVRVPRTQAAKSEAPRIMLDLGA